MLAVTQVLTELRFPVPDLLNLLGGQKPMIESPLLQRIIAEKIQELILDALKDRFHTAPADVTRHLREILDEKKLRKLNRIANKCPDLDAFREALLA